MHFGRRAAGSTCSVQDGDPLRFWMREVAHIEMERSQSLISVVWRSGRFEPVAQPQMEGILCMIVRLQSGLEGTRCARKYAIFDLVVSHLVRPPSSTLARATKVLSAGPVPSGSRLIS